MLHEKYVETMNCVNLLGAAVNADETRSSQDHEHNIREYVAALDALPLTFAGAYTVDGTLITNRDMATNFDPWAYEEFSSAVADNTSGELVLGFTPEGAPYRDMRLYYSKMPTYAPAEDQYLVVTAVSEYSVVSKIPGWVSIGSWLVIVPLFGIGMFVVLQSVPLGYVWDARGEKKYRREADG